MSNFRASSTEEDAEERTSEASAGAFHEAGAVQFSLLRTGCREIDRSVCFEFARGEVDGSGAFEREELIEDTQ